LHLSNRTLASCGRSVDVPRYDRAALQPAIVHIGVGGFHRAHQAMYLDSLARSGDTGWGVVGVGLHSATMKAALAPQDCLFTVVERDGLGDRARVVGSMCRYLFAPDNPAAVLDVLTDAQTRVVTLTVTGNGYKLDQHGAFRAADDEVVADLRNPDSPTTVVGYLVAALAQRRAAGLPGFTVLSCDNLSFTAHPDSGTAARTAVLSFARLRDERLAAWIERNVTFPSSMVDRITPKTDNALRQLILQRYGIEDRWPVVTESFTQWVIEDDFCNGRPPLEHVGVRFVSDVTPYKLLKTRLLNGTHSAMAYLGYLAGHRTAAEVMADPVLRAYLKEMMRDEIAPLLPTVPDMDAGAYQASLLGRFSNPAMSDQLTRLCARGSTKMPAYLLPSLLDARRRGLGAPLLTLAVAGWFRYLRGTDLAGAPIDIQDPHGATLQRLAELGGTNPGALLGDRAIMGSLGDDTVTRARLAGALRDLDAYGAVAVARNRMALGTIEPVPTRSARAHERGRRTATDLGHGSATCLGDHAAHHSVPVRRLR